VKERVPEVGTYEKDLRRYLHLLKFEKRGVSVKKTPKLLSVFFVLIFVSFVLFVQDALCQPQKSFLWKIQSEGNTVYVLGSLHFAKGEIYPLHQRIENAFDQSDFLVVEANVNDIGKADVQKLVGSALYPANDTLEKHVSAETYERVKKEIEGLGVPPELISKQKPWFLAMTLVALESVKLGLDPKLGIDMHFLSKAQGKKKILELESLDYQISVLSGLSDKDQELFLLYTLKDLTILEQEIDKMIQAWTSGDTKAMEALMTRSVSEDKKLSSIYEKLVYERNKKMALKIRNFLKAKETYFIIVGAGHLVGNEGIIELLKRDGYRVEQL
jgi:uncharacterized protein YbaP (TraB family)